MTQSVDNILYGTADPATKLDGHPVPAMTTLLHKICNNDPVLFDEAVRIVSLFVAEALASPRPKA